MKKLIILALLIQLFLVGVLLVTPDLVRAQEECLPEEVCLINPLGGVGVSEPRQLVAKAGIGFGTIIAFVAVAFVVFNGFKLVLAPTEESRSSAREGLKWAVGGYLVALLSFALIASVANVIGFQPSNVDISGDKLGTTLTIPESNLLGFNSEQSSRDFIAVMFFIMQNVLGLLGFATLIMLIYYGFRYITSAGNEETMTSAKDGIKWALIGLVLALLGFTIITVIRQAALTGNIAG